jgi:hypothetical protein
VLGQLWSLLDMLQNYAWQFFLLGQFLEGDRQKLRIVEAGPVVANAFAAGLLPSTGAGNVGNQNSLAALASPGPDQWLDAEEQESTTDLLNIIKAACAKIDILDVDGEIERIITYVRYLRKSELRVHLDHLRERIADEIKKASFIHISSKKAAYYKKEDLFGRAVAQKFPKIAEDIANAGTCFSVDQNTACVFHLMRAMEYCVQRLGTKLRLKLTQSLSWGQIMDRVNDAVKALPGGSKATSAQKKQKQALALAAGRLDHVRIVWRNDVMHPKATYDEAEALEVLESVRAFMISFVALV